MPVGLKVAIIFAAVTLGPVAYVLAREHSLSAGFSRVKIGDPAASVIAAMGTPRDEVRSHLYTNAEIEYHYWIWPVPILWAVGIRNGRVVDKEELQSP